MVNRISVRSKPLRRVDDGSAVNLPGQGMGLASGLRHQYAIPVMAEHVIVRRVLDNSIADVTTLFSFLIPGSVEVCPLSVRLHSATSQIGNCRSKRPYRFQNFHLAGWLGVVLFGLVSVVGAASVC